MIAARITVTRRDLVSASLALIWRNRETWIAWLFWAAVIGGFIAYMYGIPKTPRNWAALLIGATVGALVAQVIVVAFSLWRMVRVTDKTDGVVGEHAYEIRDEGLFEKTMANETLNRWSSIKSLKRTSSYIFVEAPAGAFHFIPRQSFQSEAEFDDFWNGLRTHVQSAA